LTEAVRRKPYSVVLLDEIEKAHPDVFNILLQVLDVGQLTDSLGHRVDFKNTVIIMTSNIGARELEGGKSMGFLTTEDSKERTYNQIKKTVTDEMKKVFKPEFLNRIDETIVFHPLTRDEMGLIMDLMLRKVIAKVSEKELTLEFSEKVKDFLVEKGFDPRYGARPLKRAIQKYLEDPLSQEILGKRFEPGAKIIADIARDKISFREG